MSQEQPTIRSRRELRLAREEHPTDVGVSEPMPATGRVRRVADTPVDAVAAPSERSSQIRARDRAALRAIKELTDKEVQLSGGGPPTRRQLRLQQLQAEMTTSAVPVVAASGVEPGVAVTDAAAVGGATDVAARGYVESLPDAGGVVPEAVPLAEADAAERSTPAIAAPSEMSVEQALAVRELIAAQAQNQVAKLEHISGVDPLAVDPAVLAEQIALAERAAVLNKRAAAKERLARQNQAAGPSAPSTASNLAMVTPLEFIKVPGVDRPVMKPPTTTFVQVVTSSGSKVDSGSTPVVAPSGPGSAVPELTVQEPAFQEPVAPAKPRGRARVLARAEAVAKGEEGVSFTGVAGDEEEVLQVPVAASAAYGLEPLDADTAGLGRAQRSRLLLIGVLALGIVALVAGIMMITGGLTR